MHRVGMFEVETRRDAAVVTLVAPVLVHGAARLMAALGRRERWALLRRLNTRWAGLVMRALRVDVRITGTDRLPDGPAVLLPLHESFLDPPLLMRLGRSMRFIAREELFEWRELGHVLRHCRHLSLPLHPTIGDHRRLFRQARATIEEGHDLVVFPQASVLGVEAAFASGARRIAAATGAPIVPVVITGTHRVWEHPYRSTLRRGCRVELEILEAEPPRIDPDGWRALERRMKALVLARRDAPARRYDPEQDGWWDTYRIAIDSDFTDVAEAVARHRSWEGGDEAFGVVGADEETLP